MNVRLVLPLADLDGLRSPGSSSVVVLRVGRPVYIGALGFGAGTPKSSSPKESESESELRTTWCPRDSTRLLAPEAEEACEALGGRLWSDVMTESVEPKDTEGATAEGCAKPVEASGRETLSTLVFAGAGWISLRLRLPVQVSEAGKARYLGSFLVKCAGRP